MSVWGSKVAKVHATTAIAVTNGVLVAGVSGAVIRVCGLFVMTDTGTTITIKSGTGTAIATFVPGANGGAILPQTPGTDWGQTVAGQDLTWTVADAANASIIVAYLIEAA